jgi:hypothetical protein
VRKLVNFFPRQIITVRTRKKLWLSSQTTPLSFLMALIATKSTKTNLVTQMANLAISNSNGNNKENLTNTRPLQLKSQEMKQVNLS